MSHPVLPGHVHHLPRHDRKTGHVQYRMPAIGLAYLP